MSLCDEGLVRDGEGAAEVDASGAGGKARLAFGGAEAHQGGRRESQMPGGMGEAQGAESLFGQGSGLVESALFVFGTVQGDGDDEQIGGRIGGKFGDGLGEEFSESAGGRMQAAVFEGMNRVLHAALVEAEGNGSDERRWGEAAGAAEGGRGRDGCWNVEGIAAAGTGGYGTAGEMDPADGTNWHEGKLRQE